MLDTEQVRVTLCEYRKQKDVDEEVIQTQGSILSARPLKKAYIWLKCS
jgi:hypothetical protein